MTKEQALQEAGRMKQNIIATAKKIARVDGSHIGDIIVKREALLDELLEDVDRLVECEEILNAEKDFHQEIAHRIWPEEKDK